MITSSQNAAVAYVKRLRRSSKDRQKDRLFVAEGKRFVLDIYKTNASLIQKIYYTEDMSEAVSEITFDAELTEVSSNVMEAMSDTKTPQGLLALCKIPEYTIDDMMGKSPLILILEDIRDPGNMGTIFRSFEAAGGSGIILLGDCTDPFSPKCSRATMGSIVRVPFVKLNDINDLSVVKDYNIQILAADLLGDVYDSVNLKEPVAFIIGNEARGLSNEALSASDRRINIPMMNHTESLNAATVAAILSFEAARQRRSARP